MKIAAHAKALAAALESIGDFTQLDEVREKVDTEEAALEALREQRLDEEDKLNDFRKAAEAEKEKIGRDLEIARNERAIELKNHSKVVEAGKVELERIRGEINRSKAELQAIQSAMEALRKRLG